VIVLSARALLDLLIQDEQLLRMLRPYPIQQVHISVVSIGRAEQHIQALPPGDPSRSIYDSRLRSIVGTARSANTLLPFDWQTAMKWALLLPMQLDVLDANGNLVPLGDDSRQVVATAWQRALQLVERPQPYHPQLAPHGLSFLSY